LLLGYMDARRKVGDLCLDVSAAQRVLSPLARALGSDLPALALGIVRVANAAMARALRRVTVEKGVDGRECTLLAFGGAGPMHAVELARSFDIERVVVPRFSSAFSALGCVSAEMSYTQQRTVRMAMSDWQQERLNSIRAELRDALRVHFSDADRDACTLSEFAAIRYSGQSYAVEVSEPALDDTRALDEQFRAGHDLLYGFSTGEAWELVSLRVTLTAPRRARPDLRDRQAGQRRAADPVAGSVAACWFDARGACETPRFERGGLPTASRVHGPAIIEDAWSTVVLPPGARCDVDDFGHLHIDVGTAP
jgi:N-methylhydantoinase A